MSDNIIYGLIHSPLVGQGTWQLVARQLVARGAKVVVPRLVDQAASTLPFWEQHATSVAQTFNNQFSADQRIILAAHSGAGPLLPAIRQSLGMPVKAYLFVDAGIPRDGASRLDLMRLEDPPWAEQFHQALLQGQEYPAWSEDDLRESVPDDKQRQNLVAEIKPRALPFFIEPIPVFAGWPDAPCTYIKFSPPYDYAARQARQAGWLVRQMAGSHFQMLVDPLAVTEMLMTTVEALRQQ